MSLLNKVLKFFKPESTKGIEIPYFIQNRRISNLDVPELKEFFHQNNITYFGEISSDMLRSFFKYSYSDAIYIVEVLGLYGIKFYSEKLNMCYSKPSKQSPKTPQKERNNHFDCIVK